MDIIDYAQKIAYDIQSAGGRMYYVGGYVRDKLLNIDSKDIDVEIFNISSQKLKDILSKYGNVNEFGASFGIYKVSNIDIDFALARKETKIGSKHTDFDVEIAPNISLYDAAKRRDFTINSIMQDIITGKIIDNFNGIKDLQDKVICYVDKDTFIQDSLRPLRACQFAARFNFKIDENTIDLCKHMDYTQLTKERVMIELEKALLKADKPSIFFYYANKMGLLSKFFSPINKLIGVEQNPIYHPEGDVYTHTMCVLNRAEKFKNSSNYPLALMFSAICHDLGKITTTKIINGKITSYGHENELYLTENFLKSLTNNKDLISSVKILVKNHMRPNSLVNDKTTDKAIRKLIVESDSKLVNIYDLLLLARADRLGRNVLNNKDYIEDKYIDNWWRAKLKEVNRSSEKIIPIVNGNDLITLGYFPNLQFTEMLKYAFDLQLDGKNKLEIIEKIKEKYKK